jgi:hypothetical protein
MYRIPQEKRDKVKELYLKGVGSIAISKNLGISKKSVVRILREFDIWEKGVRPWKYVNASCYWAGFLLADGNISKNRRQVRICLNSIDKHHIEKFITAVGYTGPIYKNDINNSSNVCVIGKWLPLNLNNMFDIFPQKTLTGILSPKIPKEYYADFVRGYFDGDGCLTRKKETTRRRSRLILDFTGNYSILSSIASIIKDEVGVITGAIYTWKNRNCSRLAYDTRDRVYSVLKWIYSSSTVETRLDRKYDRFQEYIQSSLFNPPAYLYSKHVPQ